MPINYIPRQQYTVLFDKLAINHNIMIITQLVVLISNTVIQLEREQRQMKLP